MEWKIYMLCKNFARTAVCSKDVQKQLARMCEVKFVEMEMEIFYNGDVLIKI